MLFLLALLLATVGLVLFVSTRSRNQPTYAIVLLNTWLSNGQQFVTFRLEPAGADVAYADLVSATYDGSVQPKTFRNSEYVFPEPSPSPHTNYTLRFTAMPKRAARIAYSPETFTVSYTPSESAHRVRVGAALPLTGIPDIVRRLRNCWYHKAWEPLLVRSSSDPVFLVTDPIPSASAGSATERPIKLLSAP